VRRYLHEFTAHADADELVVVAAGPTAGDRLHSIGLLAGVAGLVPA